MQILKNIVAIFFVCMEIAYGQFQQDEFIIGTWGNPKPYATGVYWDETYTVKNATGWKDTTSDSFELYSKRVKIAKEAGFNLLACPLARYLEGDYAANLATLTACRRNSTANSKIKLLVTDTRQWDEPGNTQIIYNDSNRDAIVNDYKTLLLSKNTDLRDYIYGYYVKDEPVPKSKDNSGQFNYCKNWVAGMKDKTKGDPSKLVLLDLFPNYAGHFNNDLSLYKSYLDDYIFNSASGNKQENSLDVVCCELYPYYREIDSKNLQPYYFTNMNLLKIKAGTRPLWVIVCTEGNGDLYNDIAYYRFCANTSLAYSAKGILYWCYETSGSNKSYLGIVDGDSTKVNKNLDTLQYDVIKTVNSEIKNIGNKLFNLKYVGTWHASDFTTKSITKNRNIINVNDILNDKLGPNTPIISSIAENNILVGIFQDKEVPTTYYLYFVNRYFSTPPSDIRSQILSSKVELKMIGDSLGPNAVALSQVYPYSKIETLGCKNGKFSFDISSLSPGAGVLYKLQNVSTPNPNSISTAIPCPADYDGDGKADLSVKTDDGRWMIDFSRNGFGRWDSVYYGFGGSDCHPCPADYDGDGKADIGLKVDDGRWFINYAINGFSDGFIKSSNGKYNGYGDASTHACPADYDGDGKADLSVKTDDGRWMIDFSRNGFGKWDSVYYGFGGSDCHPCPADYDRDGKADIGLKVDDGRWFIHYAKNGFGKWDSVYYGFGGSDCHPCPADYDGDGKADIGLKVDNGRWFINYAINGFSDGFIKSSNGKYNGYGDANLIPCPADYDGDGKADIAVYNKITGLWKIDYARNGFGNFDDSIDTDKGILYKQESNNYEMQTDLKTYEYSVKNYPNPFNPKTRIEYSIAAANMVSIKVYDILGKEVSTLVNEYKKPGIYYVDFYGNKLSSGIYLCLVRSGNYYKSQKLVLTK